MLPKSSPPDDPFKKCSNVASVSHEEQKSLDELQDVEIQSEA